MVVQLATTELAVQVRPVDEVLDAHGYPLTQTPGPLLGPWPGRASQQQDGSWVLALDPQAWPVRVGDLAWEPSTGRSWTLTAVNNLRSDADPVVDFIRASALQRVDGATWAEGYPRT